MSKLEITHSISRYTYVIRFTNRITVTEPSDTIWEMFKRAKKVIYDGIKSGLCTREQGNKLLRQVNQLKIDVEATDGPNKTDKPGYRTQRSREYRERKRKVQPDCFTQRSREYRERKKAGAAFI